ncbi:PAS domain-containing hybrid sensor histidine kinase/response regulator [Methylobacterium sp. ID0610]|uniref:PAS domain-containing hybrid sensor histidine kinase/response regulator n=1 Tax=Methylobacterium carpenticola TaxID=3344827 RepID=UPI003683DA7E
MTDTLPFLAGGGEAARMIRDRDWSRHPLGAPAQWPEAMRSALSLVLNSPESMILAWGPDLHFFFNDTYFPLLGPRLGWAMGERFDVVWADGWEQAKPIIDDALAGRSRRFVDLPWKLGTDRGEAETWWTFSYSRVLDGEGRVSGLFIFTNETTEQVRAERRQREAEAALRTERDRAQGVLDHMGEAFALLDRDLRIVDLNAESLRMEHRPAHDVIGRLVREAYPDAHPDLLRAYRRALDERVPVSLEHRYRWPDGRETWIDMRAYPVNDGLAVFYRDVTARREAEEELRRSEALLAATLDALPVGVIIADAKGRILRDNAANREIWGVPPETTGWHEYGDWVGYRPDTGERLRAEDWAMTRALRDGQVVRDELVEIERFDGGGRRLYLNNAAPIRDAGGTIIGGVVAELDVTERIAVERRLRASEALARQNAERVQLALTAGAIIGTWFWDLPADRFSVDEAFARTFGFNPAMGREGLSLRQVIETVHPDDKPGLIEAINAAIERGGAYAHQYRVRRTDGNYYWIEANGRVDHAPDGTPLSFPGVLINVDERRAVEAERDRATAMLRALTETLEQQVAARTAELMRAEEALRQSQKMEAVGQLTGGLAHDFNNLLAGISGALELMQTRISQGRLKDVDRYIGAAQGAAKRAAALTHRLLAFSRRQTLDPKPTDVNHLVQGMEELIRRTVGPSVHMEVVGASGLWPALVDPPQLENALLNLCLNARDAMPEGGRLTIETANRWLDAMAARELDLPPGQYLSLCVTDTGTGMSPEVISRAFDPFFTTKPMGQGTGLGLSMIYGFAKQSGGQVRIYSEVGEGACVCVYLPRHHGTAEAVDPLALLPDAPRAEQGETVLIVDDEPTVRMLVTEVLEDLGYIAIEAADSAEGLKVLQSDVRIDLLITDVGLPGGMNGRQMADAGRATRPDLKVLFITGYAENAAVGSGHLEPGMAVLTKPFVVETLGLRIREMIVRR